MGQERGRDGGSAAGSDLIRDLRDVGTGRIRHVFAGTCPETWKGGEGSENDRADPQDECKACDVLRRADDLLDQVSDRSDVASAMIEAFREEMLEASIPDAIKVSLDAKLLVLSDIIQELEESSKP